MPQSFRPNWFWLTVLVIVTTGFSRLYGCGVPLAAVAGVIGLAMPFGPAAGFALIVIGLNVFALGFAGWGWTLALGLIMLGLVWLPRRLPEGDVRHCLTFPVVFLAYEAGLYVAARVLGGAGAFSPGQLWLGFLQNLVAFVVLWLLMRVVGTPAARRPARLC